MWRTREGKRVKIHQLLSPPPPPPSLSKNIFVSNMWGGDTVCTVMRKPAYFYAEQYGIPRKGLPDVILYYSIYSTVLFKIYKIVKTVPRGRIQRKTWCMGPYAVVEYNLIRLQSRLQRIPRATLYARIYLNPMPESTLSSSQGFRIWPQQYRKAFVSECMFPFQLLFHSFQLMHCPLYYSVQYTVLSFPADIAFHSSCFTAAFLLIFCSFQLMYCSFPVGILFL